MRTSIKICAPAFIALVVLFVMLPSTAEAHFNATGLGPVYDGMAHFLMSPEDLTAVLTFAMFAGLGGAQYGRRALFVLPCAWLIGGLAGMPQPAADGSEVISASWLLLLGGLIAADIVLPLSAATVLAAVLGLYSGYLSGTGLGELGVGAAAMLGLVSSVFVVVAVVAAFVVSLRAAWARIGVRVAGSWSAAIGLLMLGWALRAR